MTDHPTELSGKISATSQKDVSSGSRNKIAISRAFALYDWDQSKESTACLLLESHSQWYSVSTSDKVSPLPQTNSESYSPQTPSKETQGNECEPSFPPIESSSELLCDSGTRRTSLFPFLPFHSQALRATVCTNQHSVYPFSQLSSCQGDSFSSRRWAGWESYRLPSVYVQGLTFSIFLV